MPKKEKIEQMFNDIAPSYDRLNHLMSLGIDNIWRKKALKEIVDGTQQQILDVACGTGDSTIAIAKAMEPGGRVTGIDISAGMMEPLMRKAAHEGVHDRIKLLQADALQMPLGIPDKPFIKTLYDIYFRHILPLIGGLISGNRAAYRYLPESVYAFPRPEAFCAMMERAGFHNVRHRNYTFGLCRLFIGEK